MIKAPLQKGAPQEYFQCLRQRGAAMLLFVLFFTFASTVMMIGLNQSIFTDMSDFNQLIRSKQAYLASESIVEDMTYRTITNQSLNSTESLTLGSVTSYATSTYDSALDQYNIVGSSNFQSVVRKSQATLSVANGTTFFYGMQTGTGGVDLENTAQVIGNLYSNGPVTSKNTPQVQGNVVSAGATGRVEDLTMTGSVWANTIDHISAGGSAYYNVQVGTNAQNPVSGTRYTPSANLPAASFPISTTTIQEWKDDINNTGAVIASTDALCSSGTYTINTSISIGNVRIDCDVDIKSTAIVTLTGPIWIQGNLDFTNTVVINAHSSMGRKSVPIIADKPTNRITSSKIDLQNSATFNGSGDSRSYILLLSMNNSSSLGGSEVAISLKNTVNGDLLVYAADGMVDIQNSISLKEVTAHKVKIRNSAQVIYETGLADIVFEAGPGGAYSLEDWRQTD
jgi:hypothetical protein